MIESEFVTWKASQAHNPARRMSQLSFDAVGRKARADWLALFADDAVLADPVGPSAFDPEGLGHRGKDAIGAFWDNVIDGVPSYRFVVHDSFANGPHCANVATITCTFDDGTTSTTDLVTVYRLSDDGRIAVLHAHWEMDRMLATFSRH
jgi:ketosteroid isomerase-like protein